VVENASDSEFPFSQVFYVTDILGLLLTNQPDSRVLRVLAQIRLEGRFHEFLLRISGKIAEEKLFLQLLAPNEHCKCTWLTTGCMDIMYCTEQSVYCFFAITNHYYQTACCINCCNSPSCMADIWRILNQHNNHKNTSKIETNVKEKFISLMLCIA